MKRKLTAGLTTLCVLGFLSLAQPGTDPVLAEEAFSFQDVSDLTFSFSSGAGAWRTELTISEDGSFSGAYSDSDMGDSTEEYPNGTLYLCDFSGQLSQPVQINSYIYSVKIENLSLAREAGEQEIADGIRRIYSEPYGLDGTDELLFYLAGAPLTELPEDYLSWVGFYDLGDTNDSGLPFTGLYNAASQCGFSSYENETISSYASGIDGELTELEAQAARLEEQINNGALSQSELTQTAASLYTLWDDELNSIWKRIKEILPEEEMAQLTEEELNWIAEKEAAAAEAGAEFEGGSMQPFLEYSTAAALTKTRVYELAEYLRNSSTGVDTISASESCQAETAKAASSSDQDSSTVEVLIDTAASQADAASQSQTDDTEIQTDIAQSSASLEPDTTYTLDLDGDGTDEKFSYSTYTFEIDGTTRAVLELYIDGQMVFTETAEGWTYRWSVSQSLTEDGSACLVASSISDNDWSDRVLLLTRKDGAFTILADLSTLTRKSEETPENLLSTWARMNGTVSTEKNSVTLAWTETLMSTGIITVPVTYEITDGQVRQTDAACPLDDQKTWTAWMEFDVMDSAGSDTPLFRVTEGETVSLTELVSISGKSWLKCRNSQGQEGWFPDPEEYISGTMKGDSVYYAGYFQEAVFAG